MIKRVLRTLASWFGFKHQSQPIAPRGASFTIRSFDDRSAAAAAARQDGVAALVGSGNKHKWLLMKCPCGCGQQIALNLMQSHSPRWRVSMRSPNSFSVHPSVDATSCGAHFWLRDGHVIWCQ